MVRQRTRTQTQDTGTKSRRASVCRSCHSRSTVRYSWNLFSCCRSKFTTFLILFILKHEIHTRATCTLFQYLRDLSAGICPYLGHKSRGILVPPRLHSLLIALYGRYRDLAIGNDPQGNRTKRWLTLDGRSLCPQWVTAETNPLHLQLHPAHNQYPHETPPMAASRAVSALAVDPSQLTEIDHKPRWLLVNLQQPDQRPPCQSLAQPLRWRTAIPMMKICHPMENARV